MEEEVVMAENDGLEFHDDESSVQINGVLKENENPDVDFLEDLDSYWEDINDRLTISRVVSDSIIRGMVTAIESEAADKIANKDLELSRIKETLLLYHVGSEENDSRLVGDKVCLEPPGSFSQGSLGSLKTEAKKQLQMLVQELTDLRNYIHNNGADATVDGTKTVDKMFLVPSTAHNKDTNGKHEESNETLKHLTHDELISHFKSEMNKMKRDHDYKIQVVTEECFTFKRKCLNLKERGSFSFVGKDKELEALKKKIPFVISKLDKILLEDEKLMSEGKNNAGIKSRLDSLLLENRQLKSSLSEAAEKMSQHSQVEADYKNLIRKLKSEVDDSHVEASISKDVYGCFVKEFVSQIKQETDLEHSKMREAHGLILKDLASKDARESKDDFEDSCVQSSIMEECSAVIYKEALKEADKKIVELNMRVTEKEAALRSEMLDKERLKEEIHSRECLVKEKEDLVQTAENNLNTERKKLEVVSQQINDLQSQIDQLKTKVHNKDKELRVVSTREVEKIEGYETKISILREELEVARESLQKAKDEKRKTEEKLSATKAEEETFKKHLLSLDLVPHKLCNGFNILEDLVAEKTRKTNSRLKNMQSQLSDLSHQINELKAKESTHIQRLEEKCCDLQKAEAEVDLLGDEVDTLLDLLEKIYIALDHYSPILKHYPGIIEILKLVRRELSGEPKRP